MRLGKCNRHAGNPEGSPAFTTASRVSTSSRCPSGKPWHFESPCLLEHPTHVCISRPLQPSISTLGHPIHRGIRPGRLLSSREPSVGYSVPSVHWFVTLGWYFSPEGDNKRRVSFEWSPCAWVRYGLRPDPFWACESAVPQVVLDDASTIPSLIVIHSHLLDGITTSASSLPPFLPSSDPRLPDARQGKVLSLHHLEGRSFTYKDTQLLSYNDINRSSPVSKTPFRANGSHTQIAPDPATPVGKRREIRNLWL
jgi:hypothetical protein